MKGKEKDLPERFKYSVFKKKEPICPDINVLAAYLEGKASKRKIQVMEEHLAFCPVCLNELIELRALLQEELASPSDEVIICAKRLVATPIVPKQRFIIRRPGWLTGLYPIARKSFSFAAVAATIVFFCFTGLKFGKDYFLNRHHISSAIISEISFGLSDDSGSWFHLDY